MIDEGDPSPEKNRSYWRELTGQYRAWRQHLTRGIITASLHYRRYFNLPPKPNIRFITSRSFSVMLTFRPQ
ncbi:MAG: DUF4422 domain-containing protein [Bifidobacterium pseudocatenulatum]